MKLKTFAYKDYHWELNSISLADINLIVGKNAVGKSRTLSSIDLFVKMITQKRELNWGGQWNVSFLTAKQKELRYELSTNTKGEVAFEKITIDSQQVLLRSNSKRANLKSYITNNQEEIFPPENKLVLHVRRDVKEYPYLEEIALWAEQSFGFKFGNISPYSYLNQQEYDLLTTVEHIPELFKSLKENSKQRVIDEFNELGYVVTGASVRDKGEVMIFYIKEEGIEKPIPHYRLSQGMFRTLSVIIFLEYLTSRRKPFTVIIDDLCEGLDYDRATNLGKKIVQKCLESDIQLIATSNDSFLMDVVDIKYWNILFREGSKVNAVNIKSHPDLFNDFKYTGLSNFDLFSSDYLLQKS